MFIYIYIYSYINFCQIAFYFSIKFYLYEYKIKSMYYLFSREDHLLICWHLEGGIAQSTIITEFPNDFYPTDMQWHSYPNHNTLSVATKSSLDVLLITTADGMSKYIHR